MLRLLASGAAQAKLRFSRSSDAEEIEADRIADQIVQTPGYDSAPPTLPYLYSDNSVTRRTATSAPAGERTAPDEFLNGLTAGQALDPALRSHFEAQLGHDFSNVRLHTDPTAAQSARAIGARAFTIKSDIMLDPAEYSPGAASGRKLLAHELVHVGQQRAAAGITGAHSPLSKAGEGVVQRDDKIPGWNFTPADYATLLKGKKELTIASESGWVPKKLQENILNTLRYTLDPKRTPLATEGINVQDFYHGHLVIPNDAKIPLAASSKRSAFEDKKEAMEEKTLGKSGKVTKDNLADYTKAMPALLPDYGAFLDEAVKIKGAVVIYHTFEWSTPSDLKKTGKGIQPGDPRRNYMTPLDTNTPKPYTPPDMGSASSYSKDYTHITQFAFLVGPDGAAHVRPGTTRQLSTVAGVALD